MIANGYYDLASYIINYYESPSNARVGAKGNKMLKYIRKGEKNKILNF